MVQWSYLHHAARSAMVPHCLLIQNRGTDQAAKVSQGHSISRGGLSGMQFMDASKDKSTGDQVKISYLFSKRSYVFLPDPISLWRYMVSSLTRDTDTNQNKIFHILFNNAWHPEACCLPMMMQDAQMSLQQSLRGLFSHFHNYTVSNIIMIQSYLKMYTQIFNDNISEVMCGIKIPCMIRLQQDMKSSAFINWGLSFLRKGNCAPKTADMGHRSEVCCHIWNTLFISEV